MDNFDKIEHIDIMSEAAMKEGIEEFHLKMEKERNERIIFWNSPLCETMINDILRIKKVFTEEYFLYYSEEVKAEYGWENLSDDQIHKFIEVMIDTELGMPEGFEPELDQDCLFERYKFVKKGVQVSIMYGQGTAISLRPQIL